MKEIKLQMFWEMGSSKPKHPHIHYLNTLP